MGSLGSFPQANEPLRFAVSELGIRSTLELTLTENVTELKGVKQSPLRMHGSIKTIDKSMEEFPLMTLPWQSKVFFLPPPHLLHP